MIEKVKITKDTTIGESLFLTGDEIYIEKFWKNIGGGCGINKYKVFSSDKKFIGNFNVDDIDSKIAEKNDNRRNS